MRLKKIVLLVTVWTLFGCKTTAGSHGSAVQTSPSAESPITRLGKPCDWFVKRAPSGGIESMDATCRAGVQIEGESANPEDFMLCKAEFRADAAGQSKLEFYINLSRKLPDGVQSGRVLEVKPFHISSIYAENRMQEFMNNFCVDSLERVKLFQSGILDGYEFMEGTFLVNSPCHNYGSHWGLSAYSQQQCDRTASNLYVKDTVVYGCLVAVDSVCRETRR